MATADVLALNGLPDALLSRDDRMDVDQLDGRVTHTNSFVANGLLAECDTQEETLVEDRPYCKQTELLDRNTEKAGHVSGSDFTSNGLLEDVGDDQGFMEYVSRSSQLSTMKSIDASSFDNTSLLEEKIGGLESGSECPRPSASPRDGVNVFESSGLLNDVGKSRALWGTDGGHVDSQEELPSLSQILHLNGHTREEPSFLKNSRSSSTSLLSGLITATAFDGRNVIFRRKTKTYSRTVMEGHHFGKLLEKPVHKLRDQLSEVTVAQLIQAEAGPSIPTVLKTVDDQLWVDRYRPSCFMDLLGDECVHRDTLGWLKEWDCCVFGKRKALDKQTRTHGNKDAKSENRYEDAYHRPREKLLLLAGPAGYGKTTLAHVVARQAGYDVMEINASDARSGQVIDDRIRPTLESGSAVGSKKPVCLIIDEIDGATGSGENSSTFIHKLIGLTFDNAKKGRRDKNKDTKRPLLRPIICICNDLYAASLTKLRQHAHIIRFTRPADIHLTKRLRSICESEGLRTEARAISTLVGIAKGDMRGCLNTLQFIKARQQEVTESVIRTATVGMKEGDTSFTSVMSSLFAPLAKKRVKELGMSEFEESRYVSRLTGDIDATGSADKVALGCFEHYASLRHYEASLSRHEKAANWLVAFDSLAGAMRSEREYGLMPYLSYTLVPFYPLFSERGGAKVDRPKADWDALMQMRTNEEILKSLAKCVQSAGQRCTGLRYFLSNEIMQLELAPYINRIISPPMRPINSQVTRPHDRAVLARLVDIMVSLELRFIQEKTEDGQLIYRLEPPIDAFITYDGKRAPDIAVQRYATRHVIAGEIDVQMIARHAEVVERSKTKGLDIFRSKKGGNTNAGGNTGTGPDSSALGKRKADAIDIADKPPVDFFGRPITISAAPSSKRNKGAAPHIGSANSAKAFKVSYRYNEGNSAAVRKPVKISSFL